VVLKGSGFTDIAGRMGIIAGFGIILNGWAVVNYKKIS
jgi:ABC-2 type transport system permease protein